MRIAPEKTFQSKHVAIIGVADDHRPARTRLEQHHPAQYQCAHHALAEVRLVDEECPQQFGSDDERRHRLGGPCVDQRRPCGELFQPAEKAARTVGHNVFLGARDILARHSHLPTEDHHHAWRVPARGGQGLALLEGAQHAEAPHALHLLWVEDWKSLVAACREQ